MAGCDVLAYVNGRGVTLFEPITYDDIVAASGLQPKGRPLAVRLTRGIDYGSRVVPLYPGETVERPFKRMQFLVTQASEK